jgi:hypothetical protein
MEPEELHGLLNAAKVPYRFWNSQLSADPDLDRLRAYFLPEAGPFDGDFEAGMGAVFNGRSNLLNRAVPLAARSMVLYRKEIVYAELNDIIEDRDEPDSERLLYTAAYEVQGLVIDQFYQNGIECPYDARQRRIIESLIRTRINAKMPTYFGSSASIQMAHPWWSPAILWLISEHTREITL